MNRRQKLNFGVILLFAATSSACKTKDPVGVLNKEIRSLGYISYTTPLEFSGPGTLIGGRPSQLQVVAPPQTCFPDQVEGQPTGLRFVDKTTLASKTYNLSVSGGAKLSLLKFLNFSNGLGSIGARFDDITTIHLEMSGVTVEYLDSVRLAEYYRSGMSETCKDFLDQVAFVIQALRVSKMSFQFENRKGRLINLDTNLPTQYIAVGVDYSYRVSNQYNLEITSPKYMGYQLGRLMRSDRGLALNRASTTDKDLFQFRAMNLFDNLPQAQPVTAQQLIYEGSLPRNFVRPY